ncbi:hypothetical protein HOU00_gp415 [Caulobacter phage CcrPW]|uniref:Uncharacterized protein n=1 Tax=Caulobacter phage CcrPW TaxID=2283271 RepID=A0A385EAK5_9CAUD|nr:hypothetical protein HOU00_gp415 [Caulobacter phage CcrPW]AXQ68710.1 hypothetical protein CcrPW_gp171 [Caulobacter phage CcrPW]
MPTTIETDNVRRVDYTVRAHITYSVHEHVSHGSSGSEREIVRSVPLGEARSMAEMHAKASTGQVKLRTVDVQEDYYGADSLPLGLQHVFRELLEHPNGTKWVLSRVNPHTGPMLRIQRYTPQEIPLTPARNPWDELTVAQMRQTLVALRALPWEAAKALRLQAYQDRDVHFIEVLNRAEVAMDVIDPAQVNELRLTD